MDKFLIKKNAPASSPRKLRKRTRSDAFEESKEQEIEPTPSKKLRIETLQIEGNESNDSNDESSDGNDNDDDSEYELSEDDEDDSDVENNNTNNKNTKRMTRSRRSNKKENKNISKEDIISNLRNEVAELKQENKKLKTEMAKLKKRVNSTSSSNKKKFDATKLKKKYFKKWSKRFPKVAGMKKTKFTGWSKEISIDEMGFDREEFDALFGDQGKLIQPRPDYKPKSTVIIRHFSSWQDIESLFGEYGLKQEIKVSVWRSRNFSKSYYCGQADATIDSLDVHYNKSRKVLSLKFSCSRAGF